MKIAVSKVLESCRDVGLEVEMEPSSHDPTIERIAAVQSCAPGDLVFADSPKLLDIALARAPSAIVLSRKLRAKLGALPPGIVILVTPTVPLAHAFIKQRFAARDFAEADWSGPIHPSAVVHESAVLDTTVVVEPLAVIGRGVRIGKGARIMSGAVVEHDAQIGSGTVVHPSAVVGYRCRIGADCVIGPGSIIGAEGFGFAQDATGRSHPIPQTGIVVLEDRVRLGAGNCIDRATYGETRIGAGTKFDNLSRGPQRGDRRGLPAHGYVLCRRLEPHRSPRHGERSNGHHRSHERLRRRRVGPSRRRGQRYRCSRRVRGVTDPTARGLPAQHRRATQGRGPSQAGFRPRNPNRIGSSP